MINEFRQNLLSNISDIRYTLSSFDDFPHLYMDINSKFNIILDCNPKLLHKVKVKKV